MRKSPGHGCFSGLTAFRVSFSKTPKIEFLDMIYRSVCTKFQVSNVFPLVGNKGHKKSHLQTDIRDLLPPLSRGFDPRYRVVFPGWWPSGSLFRKDPKFGF